MESALGLDMRLMYGFGVPIVLMSALICVMMIAASVWAVAVCLAIEVVLLAVVVAGFLTVIDDPHDAR